MWRPSGRHVRPRSRSGRPARVLAGLMVVLLAFVVAQGTPRSGTAEAAGFDPNYLISDAVFDATGTMTTAQIQAFLNRFPNSCLRNYTAAKPLDYSSYGGNTSAAEIIRASSQLYGVNPQVLLVTLEKEQSLVTGGAGCDPWRYASAMGYACPDGGALYNYPALGITNTCVSAQQHAGFSAQVNHGTWQLQFNRQRAVGNLAWRNNESVINYGFYTKGYRQQYAGAPLLYYDGTATISGRLVTMTNGPTATLYTYTPHLYANEVFVQLFTNWFGSPTGSPSTPPTTPTPPTTTSPPTTAPPYSMSQYSRYASAVNQMVLGRAGTANERKLWSHLLSTGYSPAEMIAQMATFSEHTDWVVDQDFRRMFDRAVDPSGRSTWGAMLRKTGRNASVLEGLAGSGEYYRKCASNDGVFVNCLYMDLLNRPVDNGGFATWTRQLANGNMDRRTVASRILASGEYSRVFVDGAYREILGRSVDSSGASTWGRIFDRSGSELDVRGGLMRSGEGMRRHMGLS